MDAEIWKAIPGYEGCYEISDRGRVKSVERKVWTMNRWGQDVQRTVKPRIRATTIHPNGGHLYVTLHKERKRSPRFVHDLMMVAFVGPRPTPDTQIRHLDGNPQNNVLSNLRYGTHVENVQDMLDHGTHRNKRKTECKRGHPFDSVNTYVRPDGKGRSCLACMKQHGADNGARYQRDYRARKAASIGR